jgi:hypothetical protein
MPPPQVVPQPLTVVVKINGHPARVLLDSGSLGDFISTSLVDQLNLNESALEKLIPLHLAVQGSRSVVNYGTKVQFKHQEINETHYFDVINLHNYDLILGTPFMFQHEVLVGVKDARVIIGSNESKPIQGMNVNKLHSRAIQLVDEDLDKVRSHLVDYARDSGLFIDPSVAPLPPMREINHMIPLIDENLVIS